MTIKTAEGREIHFATSAIQREESNVLNLGKHVSKAVIQTLMELPCFKGVDTTDLIAEATQKLGKKSTKKIVDRITAMLVIAGTRPLDHPELQIPKARV